MSNCPQGVTQEELSPSISDEKMDTASESFPSSQNTPNTPSDLDDKDGASNTHFMESEQLMSTCDGKMINHYVNQQSNNFVRNDDSYVSNPGVLRLANPPECENDNDAYRNSENYDLESVNTDTVSPLYEDTSSLVSLKGSSDFSKSSDGPKRDNVNNFKDENGERQSNESCKSENYTSKEEKSDNFHVPLRLGSNPPRLLSTLTLTDDHPLMALSSPESPPSMSNYPDLILQSRKHNRDDTRAEARSLGNEGGNFLNSDSGMLSLSSTEDESFNPSIVNGEVCSLYAEGFTNHEGPQRNTSKNNLYFSDSFIGFEGNRSVEGSVSNDEPRSYSTTADGKLSVVSSSTKMSMQPDILDSRRRNMSLHSPVSDRTSPENQKYRDSSTKSRPDVTERKKVKPDIKAPKIKTNSIRLNTDIATQKMVLGRTGPVNKDSVSMDGHDGKVVPLDLALCFDSYPSMHDYVPEVSECPDSPSGLRTSLNYELPVEHPSNFSIEDDASGDSSSESHGENEKSLYCTELDPYGGRVSLRPRVQVPPLNVPTRRRIKPLVSEADTDSMTALNMETDLPSLRRTSWSGSGSSIDSLCGYSLKSEEGHSTPHSLHRSNERLPEVDDSIEKIPEYSLSEERTDSRRWLKVTLPTGERRTIDMKVIEPYKRVLSHGGYALSGRRDAIVVFSACFLPDSSRVDYNYVMDNLFLYVLSTMEQLVTDDYILIYLHGSAAKRSMPTFHWLKKCYQLIDRRLRKSLKHLYLVHPTFWLKSIMWMTRPFISSKFSRKLTYVHTLDELSGLVPVEHAAIPERVRRFDSSRT